MAAHPFGPIENQLIVGYYKRRVTPRSLKIAFRSKDVLVRGPGSHAIYRLLQPVFYGWSPANGNSSSHDFRVTTNYQFLKNSELLSRGLGYRITFTMPEQEIRTEDPTSWPTVELEILDCFGIERYGSISANMQKLNMLPRAEMDKILGFLGAFDSLQYEITAIGTRIVENQKEEFHLPSYGGLGSSITESLAVEAEKHDVLLGYLLFGTPLMDMKIRNLKSVLGYLAQHHDSLKESSRYQIHQHLEGFAKFIVEIVRRLDIEEGFFDDDPHLLAGLKNLPADLSGWVMGDQEFPSYLSTVLLEKILGEPYHQSLQGIFVFDNYEVFNLRPIFSLVKVMVYDYLATEGLQNHGGFTSVSFETKNFTILAHPKHKDQLSYLIFKTANGAATAVDLEAYFSLFDTVGLREIKQVGSSSHSRLHMVEDSDLLVYQRTREYSHVFVELVLKDTLTDATASQQAPQSSKIYIGNPFGLSKTRRAAIVSNRKLLVAAGLNKGIARQVQFRYWNLSQGRRWSEPLEIKLREDTEPHVLPPTVHGLFLSSKEHRRVFCNGTELVSGRYGHQLRIWIASFLIGGSAKSATCRLLEEFFHPNNTEFFWIQGPRKYVVGVYSSLGSKMKTYTFWNKVFINLGGIPSSSTNNPIKVKNLVGHTTGHMWLQKVSDGPNGCVLHRFQSIYFKV